MEFNQGPIFIAQEEKEINESWNFDGEGFQKFRKGGTRHIIEHRTQLSIEILKNKVIHREYLAIILEGTA